MYPTCGAMDRKSPVPSTDTCPRVGASSPAITRSSVDFPAPLSPRMTWSFPESKFAVMPRSAANRPKWRTTSTSSIAARTRTSVADACRVMALIEVSEVCYSRWTARRPASVRPYPDYSSSHYKFFSVRCDHSGPDVMTNPPLPLQKTLVLILDQNSESLSQLARTIAEGIGAELLTCNTPVGCLEMARKYKPHVALLRRNTAFFDGISMPELIRAVSPETEIQVVD